MRGLLSRAASRMRAGFALFAFVWLFIAPAFADFNGPSASVPYTANGGSAAASASTRSAWTRTPMDFNASAGTGGDDSAAINAAITQLTADGGGTLYLPPPPSGAYNVCAATVSLPTTVSLVINGASAGATIRVMPGCATPPASVLTEGVASTLVQISLNNLRVDGYCLAAHDLDIAYSRGFTSYNVVYRNVANASMTGSNVRFQTATQNGTASGGYEESLGTGNLIQNVNDTGHTCYSVLADLPPHDLENGASDSDFTGLIATSASISNIIDNATGNNHFGPGTHTWQAVSGLYPQYDMQLNGYSDVVDGVAVDTATIANIRISAPYISVDNTLFQQSGSGTCAMDIDLTALSTTIGPLNKLIAFASPNSVFCGTGQANITWSHKTNIITVCASGCTLTTSGGAATYTPTVGAAKVDVFLVGGGGGGGGGALQASLAACSGGSGGGGGGANAATFAISAIGTSLTVTIGGGGSAGAAATSSTTAGGNGAGGGTTSFGTLLYANGSGGGAGGQLASNSGGGGSGGAYGTSPAGNGSSSAGGSAAWAGVAGGYGANGNAANSGSFNSGGSGAGGLNGGAGPNGGNADWSTPNNGASGAGAGGGISAINAVFSGGAGGFPQFGVTQASGGAAGVTGSAGASFTSAKPYTQLAGAGGAGGGSSLTAAGAGGAGGTFGGGGGGGGCADNGGTAGAGGAGASGYAIIVESF